MGDRVGHELRKSRSRNSGNWWTRFVLRLQNIKRTRAHRLDFQPADSIQLHSASVCYALTLRHGRCFASRPVGVCIWSPTEERYLNSVLLLRLPFSSLCREFGGVASCRGASGSPLAGFLLGPEFVAVRCLGAMAALAVLPSASLCVRCQASSTSTREPYNLSQTTTTTTSAVPEGTPATNAMTGAVYALFSFKPFFKFVSGQSRKMIMERGAEIGHPWAPELARLREYDWDAELKAVQNPDIEYPEYYLKPFHAYDNGNLSWDAALEVELVTKSVHANVFDPERKVMDPNGDVKLRDSYHAKLCQMLNFTPRAVVDIGCASGLSTFGLHQVFPDAHVIGVDLSPYFISVANFRAKKKVAPSEQKLPVHFLHAAGEYTGLPSGAFDLVSMCLVCHELPRSATKEIIEEAHRLLRPGGALSIMEINPYSHLVQSMVNNVFAFTAFKATEPYFDDYRTFHLESAIEKRGFMFPSQMESSPRHRTIVAIKN